MNYEEVYDQLIQFAKSEHLLNEAKEAFYLWNLNPYSVLDLTSYEARDPDEFDAFIDWFIFDYNLISFQKSIVSIYYKENNNQYIKELINSYRSIYKVLSDHDNYYIIEDLIINKKITIHNQNEFKINDVLSVRVASKNGEYYVVGKIEVFKDFITKDLIKNIINFRSRDDFESTFSYIKTNYYLLNYFIKKSAVEFSETYPSNVILFKEFNIKNRNEIEKIISKKKFFKKLQSDKDTSVFNLVDSKMNYSPGCVEISDKKIIFTSFTISDLNHVLKDLGLDKYISPSHISDPNEIWLNTKLKLLDNLTPLEAIKEKRYSQILEGILEDIFSIHIGREDEKEVSLDPYYIKKKLGI